MDGASAKSNDNLRAVPNGVPTTPTENNAVTNHSPSNNEKGKNEDTDTEMTTLKMKLPDIRKGGTSVQISLEICGVTYEGVIKAVHSMTNGISERNNNRTNRNNNNNNFDILEKEQTSTQMIASKWHFLSRIIFTFKKHPSDPDLDDLLLICGRQFREGKACNFSSQQK